MKGIGLIFNSIIENRVFFWWNKRRKFTGLPKSILLQITLTFQHT